MVGERHPGAPPIAAPPAQRDAGTAMVEPGLLRRRRCAARAHRLRRSAWLQRAATAVPPGDDPSNPTLVAPDSVPPPPSPLPSGEQFDTGGEARCGRRTCELEREQLVAAPSPASPVSCYWVRDLDSKGAPAPGVCHRGTPPVRCADTSSTHTHARHQLYARACFPATPRGSGSLPHRIVRITRRRTTRCCIVNLCRMTKRKARMTDRCGAVALPVDCLVRPAVHTIHRRCLQLYGLITCPRNNGRRSDLRGPRLVRSPC